MMGCLLGQLEVYASPRFIQFCCSLLSPARGALGLL